MKFRFLRHTADIKFRIYGDSIKEIFENSALVLKKILIEKSRVKERIKKRIKAEGRDYESLLYNFLEEFLFLFDSERFILGKIIKLDIKKKSKNYFIDCECLGDNAENYEINEHIKAVTYNEMFVKNKKNKWIAQIIVDV
jgi:SHS2 domain-containing protein